MCKTLLSIDWDYFIRIKPKWCGSYIENTHNLNYLWYKRYIEEKSKGIDIQKKVTVEKTICKFWRKILKHFYITKKIPLYISDSHKFSYMIAKRHNCKQVYLFDAHADLGYGGITSLQFEVNCANWLGKLFSDKLIGNANIIYAMHTFENPEDFKEINHLFQIKYRKFNEIRGNIPVDAIHVCRSGAWTPPWLDKDFYKFVNELKLPYISLESMDREWNLDKMTLSDEIMYLIS
ncbi:arginase [Clostridium rectalis]|uniref:arginase n=1 Tax=Clostridium rectalis TaxID=2040295 RepID=UPI000F631F40|nr:arginase [Clostridium rectalis]